MYSRFEVEVEDKDKTMPIEEADDKTVYNVVVNHEEQYSIWPSHRENPRGWRNAGKTGLKKECLEFIEQGLDGYAAA